MLMRTICSSCSCSLTRGLTRRSWPTGSCASFEIVCHRPNRLGKPTPLASLFGYIEDRVEHLQVRQTYVSTLHWQAIFDPLVLLFRDFHL